MVHTLSRFRCLLALWRTFYSHRVVRHRALVSCVDGDAGSAGGAVVLEVQSSKENIEKKKVSYTSYAGVLNTCLLIPRLAACPTQFQ